MSDKQSTYDKLMNKNKKKKKTIITLKKPKKKITSSTFNSPGKTTKLQAIHVNPSAKNSSFEDVKTKIKNIQNTVEEIKYDLSTKNTFTEQEEEEIYWSLINTENGIDKLIMDTKENIDDFLGRDVKNHLDDYYERLPAHTKNVMDKMGNPVQFKNKIKF